MQGDMGVSEIEGAEKEANKKIPQATTWHPAS